MIGVENYAAVQDTLPDALGELLRLAVRDLNAVKADGRCSVNMHQWVQRISPRGLCSVCLAGAILVTRVMPDLPARLEAYEHFWLGRIPPSLADKLVAIDTLRLGDVAAALETRRKWDATVPCILTEAQQTCVTTLREFTHYNEETHDVCVVEWNELADELIAAGL